jgi:activator of 2-hydroxyglutaryl-CoA dehydratase
VTVALGLDVGSTTCKVVAVDAEGTKVASRLEPAQPRLEEQAARMLADVCAEVDGNGEAPVVATGYGRRLARAAHRQVTEITCHARGVFRALGHGGTLVDIGGQDAKAIRIGDDGRPVDFAMNDKCAAVFAESEIISLIAKGADVDAIIRGLHRSLVGRIVAMARSVGVTPPVILSGGVALNGGVRAMMSEATGHPVVLPPDPQLMGAYGAALIAAETV